MHLGMRLERKENRFNDIYRSWEWNTNTTETNVLNQLLFIIISQIYSNIPKLDKFGVFIGIPLRLRLKRGAEGPNSCGGMGVATHFRTCPEITALTTVELNFRCEWHREDTGEAVLSCVWH